MLNSVLNVKALVGAFKQEKALVGTFSVIVQLHRLIDLRHYSQPPPQARGPAHAGVSRERGGAAHGAHPGHVGALGRHQVSG